MSLSQLFTQHIQDLIQSLTGLKENIRQIQTVSGGDINQAYRIETTGKSYFIKVNNRIAYPDMFELEADGLNMLGNNTPQVLASGSFEKDIFLLTEWIESGQNDKTAQENLGRVLARIHRKKDANFGLSYHNYIGRLHQPNYPCNNWTDFFIEQRLDYQLRLASEKKLIAKQVLMNFENLFKRVSDLYPTEPPSLLHGDLWKGNYIISSDSKPVLIDPAVYYGHREMDIAMTHLFGGFSPDFYYAYNEQFPLQPGWDERFSFWNLYPLLVHLNMFGSSYLPEIKECLKKWE